MGVAGGLERHGLDSGDVIVPLFFCSLLLLNDALLELIPSFLNQHNHSGGAQKASIVEMTGAGVCAIDYDLDGWVDLYVPDGQTEAAPQAKNQLFRNRGGLRFEDVTDAAGVGDQGYAGGCAVADIDNDGDPDLYVTNTGTNRLYINNGDGTFQSLGKRAEVDHPGWSTGAAFADLDLDGLVDLYVCNYIDREHADLKARCRYFGVEVFCGPNGLPGQADVLYHNINGRHFNDVTLAAGVHSPDTRGFSVLLTDLDGDRFPEIRVANDATMDLLFHNRSGMRFEDISLVSGAGYSGSGMEQSGMGATAADFDGDGDTDLYVTNFQRDYNTLFENEGGLRFSDSTATAGLSLPTLSYLGWGAHFFDANHDGVLDLFVANGHIDPELVEHDELGEPYAQNNQLFLGDGRGQFVETSLGENRRVSRGATLADVDADGRLDVIVNNLDDQSDLYRGRAEQGWIRFRVVGTISNRDGLGARMRLRAGGQEQERELRGSDGYLGSNELVLHFGVGEAETVDEVLLVWPSGQEERLEALTPNRSYILKEGSGCLALSC